VLEEQETKLSATPLLSALVYFLLPRRQSVAMSYFATRGGDYFKKVDNNRGLR
jgi:hypothetical protein